MSTDSGSNTSDSVRHWFWSPFASVCFHVPNFLSFFLLSLLPLGVAWSSSRVGDSGNPFLVNALLQLGLGLSCGLILILILIQGLSAKNYRGNESQQKKRIKVRRVYWRGLRKGLRQHWAWLLAVAIGCLDFAFFILSMEFIGAAQAAILFILWIMASDWIDSQTPEDELRARRFFKNELYLFPVVLLAGAVVTLFSLTDSLGGFTELASVEKLLPGVFLAFLSAYFFCLVTRISYTTGISLYYGSRPDTILSYLVPAPSHYHWGSYRQRIGSNLREEVLGLSLALWVFVLSALLGAMLSLLIGLGLGAVAGAIPSTNTWAHTLEISFDAAFPVLLAGVILPTLWVIRKMPGGLNWLVMRSVRGGRWIAEKFAIGQKNKRIVSRIEIFARTEPRRVILYRGRAVSAREKTGEFVPIFDENILYRIWWSVLPLLLALLSLSLADIFLPVTESVYYFNFEAPHPGNLFIFAAFLLAFHVIFIEAEIRSGFKAMVVALVLSGFLVYFREEIFAWFGIYPWHWGTGGYFASITVSATVFTLLLAFRVTRMVSRTSEEDNLTFAIYRKMELLVRRGHLSPSALDSVRKIDESDKIGDERLHYEQAQRWLQLVRTRGLSEADVQLLSDSQSQLDALARSKQVDIHLGEFFAIITFAVTTIGLAVLSRPDFFDPFATEDFASHRGARLLVDLFAIVVSSVIVFLLAHIWDLKKERDDHKIESKRWAEIPNLGVAEKSVLDTDLTGRFSNSTMVPNGLRQILSRQELIGPARPRSVYFRFMNRFGASLHIGDKLEEMPVEDFVQTIDHILAEVLSVNSQEANRADTALKEHKRLTQERDRLIQELASSNRVKTLTRYRDILPYEWLPLGPGMSFSREELDRVDEEPGRVDEEIGRLDEEIGRLNEKLGRLVEEFIDALQSSIESYYLVRFLDTKDRKKELYISVVAGILIIATFAVLLGYKWLPSTAA